MKREGRDVIELTIGEPDVATPPELIEVAARAIAASAIPVVSGVGHEVALRMPGGTQAREVDTGQAPAANRPAAANPATPAAPAATARKPAAGAGHAH